MVNQLCRQALEHLCAVCAQKAASKCGVKPSPGLSRAVQGLCCAQRGVNINSIRVKTRRDMSPEITCIQNIRDMQTESNWYQLVNQKIPGVCRLPKAAAKKSGTAQGRIRQVNAARKDVTDLLRQTFAAFANRFQMVPNSSMLFIAGFCDEAWSCLFPYSIV